MRFWGGLCPGGVPRSMVEDRGRQKSILKSKTLTLASPFFAPFLQLCVFFGATFFGHLFCMPFGGTLATKVLAQGALGDRRMSLKYSK